MISGWLLGIPAFENVLNRIILLQIILGVLSRLLLFRLLNFFSETAPDPESGKKQEVSKMIIIVFVIE